MGKEPIVGGSRRELECRRWGRERLLGLLGRSWLWTFNLRLLQLILLRISLLSSSFSTTAASSSTLTALLLLVRLLLLLVLLGGELGGWNLLVPRFHRAELVSLRLSQMQLLV